MERCCRQSIFHPIISAPDHTTQFLRLDGTYHQPVVFSICGKTKLNYVVCFKKRLQFLKMVHTRFYGKCPFCRGGLAVRPMGVHRGEVLCDVGRWDGDHFELRNHLCSSSNEYLLFQYSTKAESIISARTF